MTPAPKSTARACIATQAATARRILIVLAFIVVGATVAVGGTLIWALHDVPLLAAPQEPQAFPIVFEAADGKAFARKGPVRAPDARREDYPAVLVNAVTSIEDRRFFHHWGIDPFAIVRAARNNLSAGEIVQGGSTITQQLVKVLLHDDERTFTRKLREAIVALWLERQPPRTRSSPATSTASISAAAPSACRPRRACFSARR